MSGHLLPLNPPWKNLMSHNTNCGKTLEPATMSTKLSAGTAKLKSCWSGRKPPNGKLPNWKPPNRKLANQKPSNQKPPKVCHGWLDKKWVLSGRDSKKPPTTINWHDHHGAEQNDRSVVQLRIDFELLTGLFDENCFITKCQIVCLYFAT